MEKARGGVGLTMIGGATNIAPDSPSVFGQLYAGDDSIVPWFQRLTDGLRAHGAAVMCQNQPHGAAHGLLSKASESRKVVVIGGGPGGLEAARVCAERGHQVVLFEASDRL